MTIRSNTWTTLRASTRLGLQGLLLLALTLSLPASASPASSSPSILPFRFVKGFAIVVPVYLNGRGPFDFLLDTGSSCTTIDRELASSLQLPSQGQGNITTLVRSAEVSLRQARTVSIGPRTEPGVEVLVRDLDALRRLDPQIRGVLGQNVLKHADYLIDYPHHRIEFDSDGRLLLTLSGKRTPVVKLPALDNPDYFILVVQANVVDDGVRTRTFILDSGAASLVLFTDQVTIDSSHSRGVIQDDGGQQLAVSLHPVQLHVSDQSWHLPAHTVNFPGQANGFDGLLPTLLFSRLYISHSGSFVLFNPKRMQGPPGVLPSQVVAGTSRPADCERLRSACTPPFAEAAATRREKTPDAPSAPASTQLSAVR